MNRRKSAGQAEGNGPSTYEDELNGTYNKIHKTLGTNNRNKDVRMRVREELDEKVENQLTTGMNLTINPRFQLGLEKDMRSTFKDDFRGEVEEPVDKVYFRRRDEASMYAEAYFKNKVCHIIHTYSPSRSWWARSDDASPFRAILISLYF